MATRSHIGYNDPETNQLVMQYCHFDGHPKVIGKILLEHYKTIDKIKALVTGPAIRSISSKTGKIQRYTDQEPHWSRYETVIEALIGVDYAYVWEDQRWRCYTHTYANSLIIELKI